MPRENARIKCFEVMFFLKKHKGGMLFLELLTYIMLRSTQGSINLLLLTHLIVIPPCIWHRPKAVLIAIQEGLCIF